MCASMVRLDTTRRAAMSLLVRPLATRPATSRSRAVSSSQRPARAACGSARSLLTWPGTASAGGPTKPGPGADVTWSTGDRRVAAAGSASPGPGHGTAGVPGMALLMAASVDSDAPTACSAAYPAALSASLARRSARSRSACSGGSPSLGIVTPSRAASSLQRSSAAPWSLAVR